MKRDNEIPTAEDLRNQGYLLDSYPVDESQTVSNAGDAELYELGGKKYELITWNDRAEDHSDGDETVNEITEEE